MAVGDWKVIIPLPFRFLAEILLIIKDRLAGEKANRSLITCVHLVYVGYPGKLNNSLKLPKPSPWVPSLDKDKRYWVGGSSYGSYQAKHRKQGYCCYADLSPGFLHWREFIWSFSSPWYGGGDTLTNGDFHYKCK